MHRGRFELSDSCTDIAIGIQNGCDFAHRPTALNLVLQFPRVIGFTTLQAYVSHWGGVVEPVNPLNTPMNLCNAPHNARKSTTVSPQAVKAVLEPINKCSGRPNRMNSCVVQFSQLLFRNSYNVGCCSRLRVIKHTIHVIMLYLFTE